MVGQAERKFFADQFGELDQERIGTRGPATSVAEVFDAIPKAHEKVAAINADRFLSDEGKEAKRLESLEEIFVDLERENLRLAERKNEAASGMAALPLTQQLEPHLLAEARQVLRGMSQDKIDRFERLPSSFLIAAVSAPPEFSGMSPSVHAAARQQLLEAAHPTKVAGYRNDLRAVELATEALRMAGKSLLEIAKLPAGTRESFLKRVASKAKAAPKSKVDPPMDLDEWIAESRRRATRK